MSFRGAFLFLLAGLLALSACVRPTRVGPPETEDYVFPRAGAGELRPQEARRLEEAWRDVLAGDAASAEAKYLKLLKQRPGLVAAETGLAFARMRAGRMEQADAAFEAVLSRQPDYLPALMGAASLARGEGDSEAAFELYRRAQAASSDDPAVRKRLAETRLQVTERRVAAARAALEAGQGEQAVEQYRRALEAAPELSALRLELAELLVDRGDAWGALSVLEADPQRERQVLIRLGRLLAELKQHNRALEVYLRLLGQDPDDREAQRGAMEAREALELLEMPEEYRSIRSSPRISRADLAALLAVKVASLSRVPPKEAKVAVDISGSWAREHIIRMLALDIMDVYPNHTFQPGAIVRRGDVARAVASILDLLGWPAAPAPAMSDMSRSHLLHGAVARVVGAGLMDLTPEGAFEPWRPVSGEEAIAVVESLIRLLGT